MGKNGRFGKTYGKAVGRDSQERAGWNGPEHVPKETSKRLQVSDDDQELELKPSVPANVQQLLLDIFKDTFPDLLGSSTLQPLLQEVKAALYERDFQRAFGKQEYLEAYSVRWSPSRALCYQSTLVDLSEHMKDVVTSHGQDTSEHSKTTSLKVACFGGGAAEIAAFGGFLKVLRVLESDTVTINTGNAVKDELTHTSVTRVGMDRSESMDTISVLLLDSAEWGQVVQKLHQGLITPPKLSKYASAAAREANLPFLESRDISVSCSSQDVLEMSEEALSECVGQEVMLLTCLFTLNELYTASIAKTTKLLLNLTAAVKAGTLFLVVDSPGSYSETTVGSESKKYPMAWLLDHCLLTQAPRIKESTTADWVKLISEDSKWFRLPEGLRYPIPLESMRYQIHLYRRV